MKSNTNTPFVFVLMPFNTDYDDVYKLGIKAVCTEANTQCERLDEQIYQENMLDRICCQINKSDIIIAEMSDGNPNVFFESGYAFAREKKIIFISKKGKPLPFDLKQKQHIFYSSIDELKSTLRRFIDHYLNKQQHPENFSKQSNDLNIHCFVNGERLKEHNVIPLKIALHNDTRYPTCASIRLKILNYTPGSMIADDFTYTLRLPSYFRIREMGGVDKLFTNYTENFSEIQFGIEDTISQGDWNELTIDLLGTEDFSEIKKNRCQLTIDCTDGRIDWLFSFKYIQSLLP